MEYKRRHLRTVWRYQREVIRICKSKKNRQHNGQKGKQRPTKYTHKTNDRVARTPLETNLVLATFFWYNLHQLTLMLMMGGPWETCCTGYILRPYPSLFLVSSPVAFNFLFFVFLFVPRLIYRKHVLVLNIAEKLLAGR
jgi:hypothetical protein